jgi:hypothetical protein
VTTTATATDTSYVLVISDECGFERFYYGMTRADADEVCRLLPREGGAVYVARLHRNAARMADHHADGEMRGQERWYDAVKTLGGQLVRLV